MIISAPSGAASTATPGLEQASLLARGLIGEFEARFGKLDTETK